jgi:hypothetical protein
VYLPKTNTLDTRQSRPLVRKNALKRQYLYWPSSLLNKICWREASLPLPTPSRGERDTVNFSVTWTLAFFFSNDPPAHAVGNFRQPYMQRTQITQNPDNANTFSQQVAVKPNIENMGVDCDGQAYGRWIRWSRRHTAASSLYTNGKSTIVHFTYSSRRYQTNTDRCTHILRNHFINTIRNYSKFQPFKGSSSGSIIETS